MKTNYSVYEVGSKVFGISRIYKEGKPTNSITIYEAIVDNVSIGKNDGNNTVEVDYMLKTPDGHNWGDSVSAEQVSDDFYELVERIKPMWLSESNTFGD